MKKRIFTLILALVLWLSSLLLIFNFSNDTAEESDSLSLKVARYVENRVAEHFYVNHNDDFWSTTLNSIVRKCAHFIEYFYLGITTSLLLLLLFRRRSISFIFAVIVCLITAMSDEFRQQFIAGRSGQWSDVLLDAVGASCGIIVVGLISLVYFYIKSLKARVRELEGE
jgi:VanZ family protein